MSLSNLIEYARALAKRKFARGETVTQPWLENELESLPNVRPFDAVPAVEQFFKDWMEGGLSGREVSK